MGYLVPGVLKGLVRINTLTQRRWKMNVNIPSVMFKARVADEQRQI